MYNELKLNMTAKATLNMDPDEERALLLEMERKIKYVLASYGFEEVKSNSYMTHVVYVDDEWKKGKLI